MRLCAAPIAGHVNAERRCLQDRGYRGLTMAGGAAQARLSVRARWHGAADYWARLPRGCSRQQRWDDKPACRRIDGADKDDRSCRHYQGCQVSISGAISGASSPSWPRQCSIASARSSKASAGASLCRGATTAMVALRRRCSLVSMISPFKKRRSRNGRLPRASAFVCNQWETPGSNRAVLVLAAAGA